MLVSYSASVKLLLHLRLNKKYTENLKNKLKKNLVMKYSKRVKDSTDISGTIQTPTLLKCSNSNPVISILTANF